MSLGVVIKGPEGVVLAADSRVTLMAQRGIDLATFLIRSTILAQSVAIGVRGVGGPIDVAVITREKGLKFVQRKEIRGEQAGEGGYRHA